MRVCLDRTVELAGVTLGVREWPGQHGPLIHLPDPQAPGLDLVAQLAAALAPRYRLLSVRPRGGVPYQVHTLDVRGVLDQFGFASAILVGEGLGALTALLLAAWMPERASRLVLAGDPAGMPQGDGLDGRAIRDCPPDVAALRARVRCPILESSGAAEISAWLSESPATPHNSRQSSPVRPSA